MPANKNALLRYKTIDQCLRNTGRKWTLQNLLEACSDALYEYTGKDEYLSVRTIQLDIQKMRSDELGYNAPIVVKEKKYYSYSDPDYSITKTPLTDTDIRRMGDAVEVLKQLSGFSCFAGFEDIVGRLEDHLYAVRHSRKPLIFFEGNSGLKGLHLITPVYEAIAAKSAVRVTYQSFRAIQPHTFIFSPYILKEYRNRWFVFGKGPKDRYVANLALDRILEIEPAPDDAFIDDPTFIPNDYFRDIVGVTKIPGKFDRPCTVCFIADAATTPYIETKPIHESQVVTERREDGVTVFQLYVCLNFELEKSLLEFGEGVRVLAPEVLVSHIKNRLRAAVEQYDG